MASIEAAAKSTILYHYTVIKVKYGIGTTGDTLAKMFPYHYLKFCVLDSNFFFKLFAIEVLEICR